MCWDCLCVGNLVWIDVIWWVYFGIWFWICIRCVEYNERVGEWRLDDGSGYVWD